MIDALIEGRMDILAANQTVTPARLELVAFCAPTLKKVSEIVVTGPAAPKVETIEDLSIAPLHVRPSSSYHEHLAALNARPRTVRRFQWWPWTRI